MKILRPEDIGAAEALINGRGHLVFTSFKSIRGKVLFLDDHLDRLIQGADFLFPLFQWSKKKADIKKLVLDRLNELPALDKTEEIYFRLNIFNDCLYLALKKCPASPESLKLTSAMKKKCEGPMPCFLKSAHYMETDLELARVVSQGFDDVLYFDGDGHVLEASTSNIFIVNNEGAILTPPPSSMVLEGVLRKNLIQTLKNSGQNISEMSFNKTDLLNAKEIWLTNSIKGLRFVDQFEDKHLVDKSLYMRARSLFGRYGELL